MSARQVQQTAEQIAGASAASLAAWFALWLILVGQHPVFDAVLAFHSAGVLRSILAEVLPLAILAPPIFWLVSQHSRTGGSLPRYAAALFAGGCVFVLLHAAIGRVLPAPWGTTAAAGVPRAAGPAVEWLRRGFANALTAYFAILMAAFASAHLQRVRRHETERSEFQQALAASELRLLNMELQPHFVFNTLHGISALVDRNPKGAKAMIVQLSALLRSALEHLNVDVIPLNRELDLMQQYLELEKMRRGGKLAVRMCLSPDTETMMVPPLILQPLVENAIRHGASASREQGFLEIKAHIRGRRLELQVRNRVGARRRRGMGVGLRNTRERLRHLYGEDATLSFLVTSDRIATTTLLLPMLEAGECPQDEPPTAGERISA